MKNLIIKLSLVFALFVAATTVNAQGRNMKAYEKIQAEASYENRLKKSKAFTISSAKRSLSSAKTKYKKAKKSEKVNARRDAIYEKTRKFQAKHK
jgi:uncharacterized membrane protein YciS (DUF1049 family)